MESAGVTSGNSKNSAGQIWPNRLVSPHGAMVLRL